MRVLVIVGGCLLENSSANLCHVKYINGLITNGHTVDLLTVSEKWVNIDEGISLPCVNKVIKYGDSLYKRLSSRIKHTHGQYVSIERKDRCAPKMLNTKMKAFIRGLYGVYGIEAGWMLRALRFKEKRPYDLLLSLSYPPASHRVAELLILMKRIKIRKWIQIWEDPWYSDLYAGSRTDKVKSEEGRIIGAADIVYYVSPLTLSYQKKQYPQFANKMRWQPLPAYYENVDDNIDFSELRYGYFGDYNERVRNLKPFYQYAIENKLCFTICGNSETLYVSKSNTVVYPRVPLKKLKLIEATTNVLIFVCNLCGGQIPGKIYQYSATNKYILFIMDGTMEEKVVLYDYFNQFGRYVFCENNKESIAEGIRLIKEGKLPDSYRRALNCFSSEIIIEKIIQGK